MSEFAPVIGLTAPTAETRDGPRVLLGRAYVDAVIAAGGAPVIIPVGIGREGLRAISNRLDGLLLPGGVDVAPERYGESRHPELGRVDERLDELELALAAWALERDMPLLAICRGIQVLNVAVGGTLYQDIGTQIAGALDHRFHAGEPRDRRKHAIRGRDGSLLARVAGAAALDVNSLHHQSVKRVAPGFEVTAASSDRVVEAIERPESRFVLGLQCHPEELYRTEPRAAAIFRAFVDAACAARP